jgi:hypothetical protein
MARKSLKKGSKKAQKYGYLWDPYPKIRIKKGAIKDEVINNVNLKYRDINTSVNELVKHNFSLEKLKFLCKIKPLKKYEIFFFNKIKETWGFEVFDNNDTAISCMFKSPNFNLISKYLINLGKNITENAIINAVSNNNFEIAKHHFEKNHLELKIEYLELACKFCSIDDIKFLLQNKIVPNKKCFEFCLNRTKNNNYYLNKNSDSEIEYDDDDFGHVLKKYSFNTKNNTIENPNIKPKEIKDVEILNVLCNYGYALTQSDFCEILKQGIYIKNLNLYNLELNEEVTNICNKICFFPYQEIKLNFEGYKKIIANINFKELKSIDNFFKIKSNLECLNTLLISQNYNFDVIQYYIQHHNIIPDMESLGVALKNKDLDVSNFIFNEIDKHEKNKKKNDDKNYDEKINDFLITYCNDSNNIQKQNKEQKIKKIQTIQKINNKIPKKKMEKKPKIIENVIEDKDYPYKEQKIKKIQTIQKINNKIPKKKMEKKPKIIENVIEDKDNPYA